MRHLEIRQVGGGADCLVRQRAVRLPLLLGRVSADVVGASKGQEVKTVALLMTLH